MTKFKVSKLEFFSYLKDNHSLYISELPDFIELEGEPIDACTGWVAHNYNHDKLGLLRCSKCGQLFVTPKNNVSPENDFVIQEEPIKEKPPGDCNYGCEYDKHTCGRYSPPKLEKTCWHHLKNDGGVLVCEKCEKQLYPTPKKIEKLTIVELGRALENNTFDSVISRKINEIIDAFNNL